MEYGLVVLWFGAALALGALALPAATWLFDRSPGAFALPLALATVAVVGHLVGHLAFGAPALLAGLGVLAAASVAAGGRVDPDWRSLGEAGVVFGLGFALVVGFRSIDPVAAPLPLAIGEKMLDYGLLRTLARTDTLPVEDMWYAGEPVRYHYGGHMLTSLLATLTGTTSRYAYNLGLATFYGALVSTAYGLAASLAAPYAVPRRLAAGLAAFLVGLAANLSVAARVVVWLLPDGLARGLVTALGLPAEEAAWTPARFGYFGPTRVLPVDPSDPDSFLAATEFPLFAWVNGDLHAHMLVQPFVLLAAALCVAYWRAGDAPRRRTALLFGLLPPLVGLTALVNVWSFPTVAGLVALTVLFAPGPPLGTLGGAFAVPAPAASARRWLAAEGRRLAATGAATVAVVGLAVLWTLPYWLGVVGGGPGMSPAYWPPWSPLGGLLLVHGTFLLAVGPPLAARAAAVGDSGVVAAGLLGVSPAVAVVLGAPALGLFGPLLLGGWWLLRTDVEDAPGDGGDPDGGVGFETVLLVAAAGVVLLVELVTLEGERFNVIFKPYADVWLLLSAAAGVLLARFAWGWPADRLPLSRVRWRLVGRLVAVFLVVSTGLYAAFLLPNFTDAKRPSWSADDGATLDATAYLEPEFPREAPAIRWLAARSGSPTIVSAAPGGYRWQADEGRGASAPASLTGLPAVLGWFHERQYRGAAAYERRLAAVETIYTGPSAEQAALLREHEVRYVYVGPAERARYDGVTVGSLPGVEPAREWSNVTVYRVDRSALPSASG